MKLGKCMKLKLHQQIIVRTSLFILIGFVCFIIIFQVNLIVKVDRNEDKELQLYGNFFNEVLEEYLDASLVENNLKDAYFSWDNQKQIDWASARIADFYRDEVKERLDEFERLIPIPNEVRFQADPFPLSFVLFDTKGKRLDDLPPEAEEVPSLKRKYFNIFSFYYAWDSNNHVFRGDLTYRGNYIGRLLLYSSFKGDRVVPIINTVIRTGFLLTVFFILGIIILIYTSMKRFMKPIEELSLAAVEVAHGNYKVQVDSDTRSEQFQFLMRSFNNMSNSLDLRDQYYDELASNFNHELKTPLTILRGELDLLKKGYVTMTDEHLDSLLEEVGLLEAIVENILDDGDEVNEEFVDLNIWIPALLFKYESRMQNKGIQIKTKFESQRLIVLVDLNKLKQVFYNLLENSYKYMKIRKTSIIEIETTLSNNECIIDFKNNGPPIPKDKLEKIFERLTRLDEHRDRKSGGHGLGLQIARNYMKQMNGYIYAIASEEGAHFRMGLPFRKEEKKKRRLV